MSVQVGRISRAEERAALLHEEAKLFLAKNAGRGPDPALVEESKKILIRVIKEAR
jgi:hypothetical protein